MSRYKTLEHWLSDSLGSSAFNIEPASEDASFRTYYRLFFKNQTFIIMDAPPEHENCKSFIKITKKLHACHLNAPIIHNVNLEKGFLLLSDFGNDLYLNALNNASVYELYSDAIIALITMQLSSNIGGLDEYDTSLLKIEMELFTEWLIQKYLNIELTDNHVSMFNTLFNLLIKNALEQPKVFVHRDFHSRNLMITKDNNPGIIDYQDAVYGPITYDLVSVLKDCYIKWPHNEISKWVDFYLNRLHEEKSEHKINRNEFIRWFDLMGVQRHLKACGIFARLSNRDGKHNFVKDIPRTLSYILDLREIYSELKPACIIIEELILPRLEERNRC